VLNVSFCSKNSLEKDITYYKLIVNAVVKYSLQMQQRMVSVAVSKLGKTDFVFVHCVQSGAKIILSIPLS